MGSLMRIQLKTIQTVYTNCWSYSSLSLLWILILKAVPFGTWWRSFLCVVIWRLSLLCCYLARVVRGFVVGRVVLISLLWLVSIVKASRAVVVYPVQVFLFINYQLGAALVSSFKKVFIPTTDFYYNIITT